MTPNALLLQKTMGEFQHRPRFSIIMPVYDPPLDFLAQAIASVKNQIYPEWELCIADDASKNPEVRHFLQHEAEKEPRIRCVFREENGHISAASNSALGLASGDFVALMDNDDLLPEQALFWVAQAIHQHPDAALLYSDEDKIDAQNRRFDPHFKSDFNPELLLAQNMISHLGVFRRGVIEAVGGFRTGFEGAQDYDLALRVVEQITPAQIVHIPRILYHWRAIAGSTALEGGEKNYAADAGRRAVCAHLERTGKKATVSPTPETPAMNRVRFALPDTKPLVSLIIPTRDRIELLSMCLDSILEKTTYPRFEIIVIDNASTEPESLRYFEAIQKKHAAIRVIRDERPFNFSALNNAGARAAQGEVLCLMNNDIEILSPDWMEEMLGFALQPEVGCVGARLWYPDGRLQHGGVILGIGGIAGHSHKFLPKGEYGYFSRGVLHQALSAVTAACLMIRKSVFDEVGGLDEELAVAFNDVDFCLRVRKAGYRNVWTPYAEMNHHESASRGYETTPEKQQRFAQEIHYTQARWGKTLYEDPFYNLNLTHEHEDFSLAFPPRHGLTPL
jgi:O-antigen biosynthesis protein